jgi:hypothetical protein
MERIAVWSGRYACMCALSLVMNTQLPASVVFTTYQRSCMRRSSYTSITNFLWLYVNTLFNELKSIFSSAAQLPAVAVC